MALADFQSDLTFISKNSAKLSRALSKFAGSTEMLAAMVKDGIIDDAYAVLLRHLQAAIVNSKEYAIPEFSTQLIKVFSRPGIITITKDKVDIYRGALAIAGNWGDLWGGIDKARASLDAGERMDRTHALAFWKERIYRPAREGLKRPQFFKKNLGFYKTAKKGQRIPFDYASYGIMKYGETLRKRLGFWGDRAPYWLWLNFGNAQSGQGYPMVQPTHFIESSEMEIDALYRQEVIKVTDEFTEAVSDEVEAFLQNPQAYEPGQELARFEVGKGTFRLGVTPTGQLGVRRTS